MPPGMPPSEPAACDFVSDKDHGYGCEGEEAFLAAAAAAPAAPAEGPTSSTGSMPSSIWTPSTGSVSPSAHAEAPTPSTGSVSSSAPVHRQDRGPEAPAHRQGEASSSAPSGTCVVKCKNPTCDNSKTISNKQFLQLEHEHQEFFCCRQCKEDVAKKKRKRDPAEKSDTRGERKEVKGTREEENTDKRHGQHDKFGLTQVHLLLALLHHQFALGEYGRLGAEEDDLVRYLADERLVEIMTLLESRVLARDAFLSRLEDFRQLSGRHVAYAYEKTIKTQDLPLSIVRMWKELREYEDNARTSRDENRLGLTTAQIERLDNIGGSERAIVERERTARQNTRFGFYAAVLYKKEKYGPDSEMTCIETEVMGLKALRGLDAVLAQSLPGYTADMFVVYTMNLLPEQARMMDGWKESCMVGEMYNVTHLQDQDTDAYSFAIVLQEYSQAVYSMEPNCYVVMEEIEDSSVDSESSDSVSSDPDASGSDDYSSDSSSSHDDEDSEKSQSSSDKEAESNNPIEASEEEEEKEEEVTPPTRKTHPRNCKK